ncbi:MAG TPA: tRNA (adenosine(37)-N6)-threonylcarbamoyltransferase complex ATPase subunit type 1 TsaE [Candidatus Paceibacterota bacterium]|nr:tRNA (adenosine(37)-N6)-threonylcarbamoyltransferase complex ATPase subunit type 1 TsaE [Candidatus Paceibacterota bacterium]
MKVKKHDLQNIAHEVLEKLPKEGEKAAVVALQGDLGAGKTTFTQALAAELGITETIQSPTYVLMKDYPISFGRFTKLIHIDAYRLESPEEFAALKPETFLTNPENLVVIEWPERIEGQLPTPDMVLKFSHDGTSDEERYIEM